MNQEAVAGMILSVIAILVIVGGAMCGFELGKKHVQNEAVQFDHAYWHEKTKEFHWRHIEERYTE
jgi:hypothetical protein